MIGLGAALVTQFSWVLYLFGAFLVVTGIKDAVDGRPHPRPGEEPMLRWLRSHLRVTPQLHGKAFFVRAPHPATGRAVTWVTPLFLALCMVEFAGLIFGVDSVPAILPSPPTRSSCTRATSSPSWACVRLYFALSAMIHRFAYRKYALALVLVFIGSKIFLVNIVGKIPRW